MPLVRRKYKKFRYKCYYLSLFSPQLHPFTSVHVASLSSSTRPSFMSLFRSILLLLNACTSKAVTMTTFCTLLLLSTPYAYLFGFGSIINMFIGKVAKKVLNISRPTKTLSTPGMPSSHATSLSYFATGLSWILRSSSSSTSIFNTFNIYLLILLLWSYVFLICYVRVSITNVHTVRQILAGLLLGTSFSTLWYHHVLSLASTESIPMSEALIWFSKWRE